MVEGVTTFESLCMGVPVVCVTSDSKIIHRSSSMILSSLGLDGWVAETKDEYVEIVCNWVRNLGELRQELRDRALVQTANLFLKWKLHIGRCRADGVEGENYHYIKRVVKYNLGYLLDIIRSKSNAKCERWI